MPVKGPSVKTTKNKKKGDGIRSPGDNLNQEIIRLLEKDGRMAFSEIAQLLDVSEGTIRNRVNGMREHNQLRIVAMADPVAQEYKTDAMIGISVAPGTAPKHVAERLSRDPRVIYVLWVTGRYDLMIEIVSENEGALQDFLESEVYDHDDIADVDIMVGIRNFKNQFLLKGNWHEEPASSPDTKPKLVEVQG